ncbi:hypothetical protein [Agaribacterium sp. ZY112]|uniref:hypothetical protein n=1 Tax=Agaribacterium sp. ZY112 TaxID=3233574 RepID=UPI003523ED6B
MKISIIGYCKGALASVLLLGSVLSYADSRTYYGDEVSVRGFPVESAFIGQFCLDQNSNWVNSSILYSSPNFDVSAAKYVNNDWVLGFPDDVVSVVRVVTCSAPSTVTIPAGTRRGAKIDPNSADQVCAEAGYGPSVSYTTTPYTEVGLASWTGSSWQVYGVPIIYGPPLLNTVECEQ